MALVLAYVISVCLYLHILSAFVLGGFDADNELNENLMTTAVIAIITAIGITKGLKVLDVLEHGVSGSRFSLSCCFSSGSPTTTGRPGSLRPVSRWPRPLKHTPWEVVTIVAGTLIVVQGFETPRYLGCSFDADVRVSASRWSQIISTAVYVMFVALALPVVHTLNGKYDDNSLIALVGVAASLLAVPLIVAAALSQFSAAVADTHAATGNLQEVTHGHLTAKWGCILVGGGAIALTWSANTLEISRSPRGRSPFTICCSAWWRSA